MPKPKVRPIAKEDNVLSQFQDAARDAATGRTGSPMTDNAASLTSDALLDVILTSLASSKAEDIVKIDLRGKSEIADWMVVASGRSSRQVAAMAEQLVDTLKQDHGRLAKVEGRDTGDWVLVDFGDAIIHVFRPEVREFYQLEKMWLTPGGTSALQN